MDVLRVILFVGLSAALAYVSRASLKDARSHGFYRFFAWECILGLFFLNFISFQQWFGDPFSVRQLISWFLLIACIVPAAHGVHLLRTQGKPDARRPDDAPLVWIEKTTQLVTTGAFKYIRHPLYSSLLLLAWGVFFKHPSWLGGGVVLGATGFLLATAKVEEAENVRYFGAAYQAYMQNTKMFIPFVF
ncbi:MAG: isoprenylcysteine carboxylmethyltransferase family protein [Gemmatimonadetes bacterium]|nr:isoprenylcysteine carboxylmethyltransferase family protein [Gemmatimonadota bacterium]NIO31087.1 isoprenylcysteine carboxylmethyltransferase family protein [Gemmatimonadota bacterium]